MAFLDMQGVSYTYPGWPPVVQRVDWDITQGEFHCLVGRSGCGKTTLLKLAAGLLQPDEGQVSLQGQAVRQPGPGTGFVFQAPTLLDWLTVLDNVLLPVTLQRQPTAQDVARAEQLLAQMGLVAHAGHYPRQLSGGQQSRVAIARALVLEPPILLMDEPFAALDAITREELQDELQAMCRARGTSVFFVTHDIAEAVYLADRVAVMEGGRIRHDIRVELPRSRTQDVRYSAAFNALCAELRRAMDMDEEVAA
ncbi:MAG: nitrate ABC transporter ATP-binding protein [Curvibacter sp. GWA2_64_110]|nr:MAG: nitrate ABC transporter ATP-binding protein [Curvibacter sp. GWA2_64_110]HCY16154.1 nitrate ABC transporter ATP-binding protein [Curvibacter sp.]